MISVTYRVQVAGQQLACSALTGSSQWGRQDALTQPDSMTATVVLTDADASQAHQLRLGELLEVVALLPDGSESVRFAGELSDMTLDHEAQTLTLQGHGQLARLARQRIGDVPWPQETDGQRILRIMDAAGLPTSAQTTWATAGGTWASPATPDYLPFFSWRDLRAPDIDVGSVQILARDVDSQPVTKLLQDVAATAAGVIFERRNGSLAYQDSLHRSYAVDVDTDACAWLSPGSTFVRSLGELVNTVTLPWGPEPDGGGQREQVTVTNDASVADYGPYAFSRSGELALLSDAQEIGRRLVTWLGWPRWNVQSLNTDSDAIPADQQDQLARLLTAELGDTLKVAGIAPPAPASNLLLIVEGASERYDGGRWQATFYLTDARQTVMPGSWADHAAADPGRTWQQVPAGLIWTDADALLVGS